jgi:hypothetical protein
MRRRAVFCWAAGLLAAITLSGRAGAQSAEPAPEPRDEGLGLLELHFTPVGRAQIAIWIEDEAGTLLQTVRLTEAVARRGIGNRPGASQMNSGFRWPYGRRLGALPIWASRRASAPGARAWKQVIFQDRTSEGLASRTSDDFSRDDYYCLSFDQSRSTKDALDAVSCASVFNSDKGRFLTEADVANGYSEPYEVPGTREPMSRALPIEALYPPRLDVTDNCGASCNQHADVAQFVAHAREVMPEIDAITMATPVGGMPQVILFELPAGWEPGKYRACLEVNVEGDYNEVWNDRTMPTPRSPLDGWDSWAVGYGYPYRGQPSVVYCADFESGGAEHSVTVADPVGSAGNWSHEDGSYGGLRTMDGMTDDPTAAPGSGADRLQLVEDGYRLKVVVKPPLMCSQDEPPSQIEDLKVDRHSDELNAHQWAELSFRAARDDRGVFRYEVRVSSAPITDEASFMAATPAKEASLEAAELRVPTTVAPGDMIAVEMGGLVPSTHYYVGVRAMDGCTGMGPIAVAELTTTARVFSTVTPCFVATASYGSALASEVSVLRRLRDRHLQNDALGRALVAGYYAVGPALSELLRDHDDLRALTRAALRPLVELARLLQ